MADLSIGIAGLAGTIDVCIKWGKGLLQACQDYKKAESELDDLTLRIQLCWLNTAFMLNATLKLESMMSEKHEDILQQTLDALSAKLKNATLLVSKCDRRLDIDMRRKAEYTRLKARLRESVIDLEEWSLRYQRHWLLLAKSDCRFVERLLDDESRKKLQTTATPSLEVPKLFLRAFNEPSANSKPVIIAEEHFKDYIEYEIPHSTARIIFRSKDSQWVIVDTAVSGAVKAKDAQLFARRLRKSDPFTFGIFSCKGFVNHSKIDTISFLFRVPVGYDRSCFHSLRQLLLSGQPHESLTDCLDMARRLVDAVYSVHLYEFVHKRVCPETILAFGMESGKVPSIVGLVGFQVVRKADGQTYAVPNSKWEVNLYLHPQRQGANAQVAYYIMQHDIYSLGVCLLEIGLWQSFVTYDTTGVAQPSAALDLGPDKALLKDSKALQDHLVQLSTSPALKMRMGNKYSEIVKNCLTCLDEDNLDFGHQQEFQDDDGVTVGVRYIEKVLEKVHGISL